MPTNFESRSPVSRRAFLRGSVAIAGALVTAPRGWAAPSSTPLPCPSSGWMKAGPVLVNPLDNTTHPGWFQNFTSPAEPLENGDWRLWISLSGRETEKNIGFATGNPEDGFQPVFATCSPGDPDTDAEFAIGNLPEGWHPVQVVHLHLQDGRHRIYFWAHGKGIVRYLAADSDDGKRYRVVDPLRPCIYHPADRAVGGEAAVEAKLSRWEKKVAQPASGEPLAPARLISNDATNVYQLPDGSFEMYSVALTEVPKDDPRYMAHDNIPGMLRVIDRYTSEDGLHWEDRRRVIERDDSDPVDQQFYYLSVTHTDRGRVGLLGHYRLESQTIDMEWCFSADGIHWERPRREPWLPRGSADALDSYMVHAPHALVQREGKWWLFYTGGNFAHNHKESHGTPNRGVFLATCEDIWAGA